MAKVLTYEVALINREAFASLKEGETLSASGPVRTVDYYKEYSSDDRSLVNDVVESLLLPHK